jgi:hypothetical protein
MLGILLSAILVEGIAIGEEVSGSLATISYNVTSPSIQTIPASFNLGNLTAGQKGSLTENATLTIITNGTYTVKLKEDVLEDVFSEFNVTIHIANYTFTLQLHGKDKYIVYLNKGTYTVNIKISYIVSQHPEAKSVSNIPFLIIKYGYGEDENNNGVVATHEHEKHHKDHDDDNEGEDD